jgi:hypothetical protein
VLLAWARGDVESVQRLTQMYGPILESADVQDRGVALVYAAVAAHSRGDFEVAQDLGQRVMTEIIPVMGVRHPVLRVALTVLLDTALQRGDVAVAEKVLEDLESRPVGHLSPYLLGEVARFRAKLDVVAGRDAEVEGHLRTAERHFEQAGLCYQLAVARGELAEWLFARERYAEAAGPASLARAAFDDMRVTPWLHRLESVLRPVATPATA